MHGLPQKHTDCLRNKPMGFLRNAGASSEMQGLPEKRTGFLRKAGTSMLGRASFLTKWQFVDKTNGLPQKRMGFLRKAGTS